MCITRVSFNGRVVSVTEASITGLVVTGVSITGVSRTGVSIIIYNITCVCMFWLLLVAKGAKNIYVHSSDFESC